ncbi:MAG: thioredoxin family protein [Candidatus Wallbacteria bacterium]|nr:thioredoxin family protein [Candidatus Wallbacteria bacterium]
MKNIGLFAALILFSASTIAWAGCCGGGTCEVKSGATCETAVPAAMVSTSEIAVSNVGAQHAVPLLVDLGAKTCIPCKMMMPVLENLKKDYAGSLEVVFIDVWEDRSAGEKYGVKLIPTQIFFDQDGKELFRHEGFFASEEILAKWKSLGVSLKGQK